MNLIVVFGAVAIFASLTNCSEPSITTQTGVDNNEQTGFVINDESNFGGESGRVVFSFIEGDPYVTDLGTGSSNFHTRHVYSTNSNDGPSTGTIENH